MEKRGVDCIQIGGGNATSWTREGENCANGLTGLHEPCPSRVTAELALRVYCNLSCALETLTFVGRVAVGARSAESADSPREV